MRSVLDQRYADLEYIVIDGGSTDGSVDIIGNFEDRLAYWQSAPDSGPYAAVNTGFQNSTGEIMGWLNSDDMHLPWTLRAVVDIFETFPQVSWVSTLMPGSWDYTGFSMGFWPIDGFAFKAFLDGKYFSLAGKMATGGASTCIRGYIQQESTFWRRSLWEKAGGYVSNRFGPSGDFELWSRFYRHAELYGVGIPLAAFRVQHQQQSADEEAYAMQCLAALNVLREEHKWSASKLRYLGLRLRHRFSSKLLSPFEYTGKRIVRCGHDSPGAHWKIETHRFV
jgi:glycosyltransferase involved in cell wall biosynthesis